MDVIVRGAMTLEMPLVFIGEDRHFVAERYALLQSWKEDAAGTNG